MTWMKSVVKMLTLAVFLVAAAAALPAGETGRRPHMMYFYNPTCRLCTNTNEIVGAAEEKYAGTMSHQRYNIADAEAGVDNVMFMFALLDELEVPEGDNITLAVFLGFMDVEDDEEVFEPKRYLIEGENIIPKLDGEIADFLETEWKGGAPLGFSQPAGFFRLQHGPCLADSAS